MKQIDDSLAKSAVPDAATCLLLYEQMVLLRQFELTAQKQYKAGRMPGFIHLYVGEEAVAVGVCAHLRPADGITSTHRGHGHALAKGVPAKTLMAELYGKGTGCSGGRGGSMHLYDVRSGLYGTNGFVGGGIPIAVGIGLSAKVRKTDHVSVPFFGDGAANHGAFHESINLAAAQNLPVIFVCENNLYATATPLSVATKNTDIASRAAAYGIPGVAVDGNDVLAVWQTMSRAVERARNGGGPTLIEAKTYRTVGHHEGDPLVGTYRTQEELDAWKARCPILRFRNWLLSERMATEEQFTGIEERAARLMEEAVHFAETSPLPHPATAHNHVWAEPLNPPIALTTSRQPRSETVELNWLDAVRDGIAEEMRHDPNSIYLGEGIGERGGSFAHTKGLWKEFGAERVIDTPICELAFTGAAAGSSATGCRSVADLMFADFLFEAASQIVQQAGKLRYMSNGQIQVPAVIRASMGAISKNAGPHHSGTYYPIWAHCPGLIVVVPSNPADAKGLIKTALRASDPVIFLEHKALFGLKGQVPVSEYYLPFGQAAVVREGKNLTVVSCGELVNKCLEAARTLEKDGISCEVIDLRTILPLDMDTIVASIRKTGSLLVVDEAFAMCGLGGEICARIMEEAFDELDAPVGRLHPDPVAQPFSPALENQIIVTVEKIKASAKAVISGNPARPRQPLTGTAVPSSAAATLRTVTVEQPRSGTTPTTVQKRAVTGVPIMMPNQDLTVTEGTVVRWLKKMGDPVEPGEVIVEVETAKAIVPVESPYKGVLTEILATEGATIPMTQPLGSIARD